MVDASQNPSTMAASQGPMPPRTANGQFATRYAERRGAAIALRLPQSLDQQLRETVGWGSKADNKTLTAWIEAAICEKLQRQGQEIEPSSLPPSTSSALRS